MRKGGGANKDEAVQVWREGRIGEKPGEKRR